MSAGGRDGLRGWELPDQGVLFVVSGPSGVGKSTLVKQAMRRMGHAVGLARNPATRELPAPFAGKLDDILKSWGVLK